jgi:hypothetical protein
MVVRRETDGDVVVVVLTFGFDDTTVEVELPLDGPGRWRTIADSRPGSAPEVLEPSTIVLERPARAALVLRRES